MDKMHENCENFLLLTSYCQLHKKHKFPAGDGCVDWRFDDITRDDTVESYTNFVYILVDYTDSDFYIVMISEQYSFIKSFFDEINKEINHGYMITKCSCDVDLMKNRGNNIDWIEVKEDGSILDIMQICKCHSDEAI